MIDRHAARLIVERETNIAFERQNLPREQRLRVFDERTIETPWGWVMYFGDSLGDVMETQAGVESKHPPCLVSQRDGELLSTGKSWPLEKYIEDFETQLLSQR